MSGVSSLKSPQPASLVGATIVHRTLTDLFAKRGARLDRTYQINTGGNTDFLNMLNHARLASRKTSKTEAVQSVAASRMGEENIHIGPSDYMPWQNDNKVCFLRMEGQLFGQVPMNLELRLSVEDSPNSAGVAIDAIRCAKLALERGQGGVLYAPAYYFCKHPPRQYNDDEAYRMTEAFITGGKEHGMKCLILAAGRGSRLQSKAVSKPLCPVLGVPLIERTIRTVLAAGADEFYAVTGYQSDALTAFLEKLAGRLHLAITCVYNPDWEQENGSSVLAARQMLGDEPFLLMMADHIIEPALVTDLLACPPDNTKLFLAVDRDLSNPLVDETDVTCVRLDADACIRDIGKGFVQAQTDGYDTGVFLAGPALFDALAQAATEGETSLSEAVRRLAREGCAQAVDVTGRLWIDVDSVPAFTRAENALLDRLRGKPADGPVAHWFNRPISIRLSRVLATLPVTPNQISLFSFALSCLAAVLFASGSYLALIVGGLCAQAGSVIDGCDGEVARLKLMSSDYGGWFDAVLDRYADGFLLFGLTWYLTQGGANPSIWIVGFVAIIGSFVLSYTADKYDRLMYTRIMDGTDGMDGRANIFRLGRDVRVFLIMIGALTDQVFLVLTSLAFMMNGEVLRRIWVCREAEEV